MEDNENPNLYLTKLLDNLSFTCSFSIDFHGIVGTQDGTLKFEFGSHHGGIRLLDQKRKIILDESTKAKQLEKKFTGMSLDDFQTEWINCHAEELSYSAQESGFQPQRLINLCCYISPLTKKIEEIFDFL